MPTTRKAARGRTLTCRKRGARVPAAAPRCPHPEDACKFRTDCLIYAAGEIEEKGGQP